jgi:hypothetical protein
MTVKKHGGARVNSGRKLPAIDERRAFNLYAQGVPKREIADRFGVPYKSILTFFKKAGKLQRRLND